MYNLIIPLARVRLSKHYTAKTTTMYRSLRIKGNGIYITKIFRPDTEITGNNRLQPIDTLTESPDTYGVESPDTYRVCAKDAD